MSESIMSRDDEGDDAVVVKPCESITDQSIERFRVKQSREERHTTTKMRKDTEH